MTQSKAFIAIFLGFLLTQGGCFVGEAIGVWSFSSERQLYVPVDVVETEKVQPVRTVILCASSLSPHKPMKDISAYPAAAWTLGCKMDWAHVTLEHLLWIPGITPSMAKRLLRIRDLYPIGRLEELASFPHIGRKTVQRLRKYCHITHAS